MARVEYQVKLTGNHRRGSFERQRAQACRPLAAKGLGVFGLGFGQLLPVSWERVYGFDQGVWKLYLEADEG